MYVVKKIIVETIKYLEQNIEHVEQKRIINLIKKCVFNKTNLNNLKPNLPSKRKSLIYGLSSINSRKINPLKNSILNAYKELYWKVDNGEYYSKDSKIGNDYINGNMNTELIGPFHGYFKSDGLKLGIFLLEQNIFYKDHIHETPELYLNLTPNTKWRFKETTWVNKHPGAVIYNYPFAPHAIKVGNIPFLSIWCWPFTTDKKCIVLEKK